LLSILLPILAAVVAAISLLVAWRMLARRKLVRRAPAKPATVAAP
jgi:hypothetical protein